MTMAPHRAILMCFDETGVFDRENNYPVYLVTRKRELQNAWTWHNNEFYHDLITL